MTEAIATGQPHVIRRLLQILQDELNNEIVSNTPTGLYLPGVDSDATIYVGPNQRVCRDQVKNANVWVLIYPGSGFGAEGMNTGDGTTRRGILVWPVTIELGCVDALDAEYTLEDKTVTTLERLFVRLMYYFGAVTDCVLKYSISNAAGDDVLTADLTAGPEYDILDADNSPNGAWVGTMLTAWAFRQEATIPLPAYTIADP